MTPDLGAAAEQSTSRPPLPLSLRVVAWGMIAWGIAQFLGCIVGMFFDTCVVGPGILEFFTGLGLRDRRRGWWIFGCLWVGLYVLVIPIAVGAFLFKGEPGQITLGHRIVAEVPRGVIVAILAAWFALAVLVLGVLLSPRVRGEFAGRR